MPSGEPGDATVLTRLLPYLWPKGRGDLKARIGIALLCLVAAKLANVYVPIVLKHGVDALIPGALSPSTGGALVAVPIALLIAYGAMRVAALGFGELRDAVFSRVAQNAIRGVALETFRHLHRLSLRFHLERQTGGLSRAIERGTKGIEFLLSFMLFSVLPTILEITLVCGILWYLFDWRFALVPAVVIALYILFTFRVTEWRIRLRREMNQADSDASTKAVDSLLNYETVKYFGNEGHEARRFDRALAAYETAAVKSRVSLSLLNVGQAVVISSGMVVIMLMAAFAIKAGRATVGDFVMVNAYLMQLAMPLNFLGTVYREIKQALIDLSIMFGLIDQPAEVTDLPGAPELEASSGHLVFEGVDFGYDARRPILKDVSFEVPPGKTVAIVGPSGAGKSTVSRILFRFYDVSDGRVVIDGQNIREVTQSSLRAAIGIVPQDTVLFNDTLYYNIAYGRPQASREEVEEAARMARLDDFVRAQPDGYDTLVGERGLKLSGGEKQRVAIARALLKRPRIMLFDEATSALDTKTEQEIQQSLEEVAKDRTTLVIAHRLSTVVDADQILVLEEGRIVERGRHAALIDRGGRYAEMWARQQQENETDQLAESAAGE